MFDEPFVFVDIETNGGNGVSGRVIEVAAIKVLNGQIIGDFQSLVNPGGSIPFWITNLTGISNDRLVHAPYFGDIASQLHEFMNGCIFVAHNVLFDYSFLKREFKGQGIVFSPKLFCTVKMSRAIFPEHKGHSLQKIIDRHGLATANRHRAYDDALVMYEYVKLAIKTKGEHTFRSNLTLQIKTKSLPPNVNEDLILSLPETPGVYIFEDDAGLPLYVGKSVNIRTRVRSHFTNATSIAKEMKLSLSSHNIRYITTETELEALLLESAKVKELQPVFNRLLRRKTSQSIIVKQLDPQGYINFTIQSHDLSQFSSLTNVYGVFSTKAQAKAALDNICRTYQLCPKLSNLEKAAEFCFRRQLGLCKGACGGLEAPEDYNKRVEFAMEKMKLEAWPYTNKVAVAISSVRSIIVDQWIPQGIYDHLNESYTQLNNSFDIDTYKILRAFMRNHKPSVKLMSGQDFYAI